MSDPEKNVSNEQSGDIESEDFVNPEEHLFLEDMEEARLAEHAVAIRQYVAAAEQDTHSTEVDSDEERSIIRDIRAEITRQVRLEMQAERAGGSSESATAAAGEEEAPPDNAEFLAAQDPRLREELERMRKLDKILLRKMRREKEVKRSRIEQERRFREELRQLETCATPDGSKMSKDVRNNMLKFMALKPPPKHNAGVYSEQSPPPSPVFQTEYLGGQGAEGSERSGQTGDSSTSNTASEASGKRRSSGASGTQSQKSQADKNFIKRNIELAGMASEVVAMTEEERVRLDSLLCDMDTLPPSFESPEDAPDFSNPFKVAVKPGEGFSFDLVTKTRMEEINSRLSELMPPGDFDPLATPSADSDSMSYQPSTFLRMQLEPNFDLDQLGEEALREVKASRDLKTRLESIDGGLEALRSAHEADVPSPHLDASELEDLLGQCVRSLSRSTFSRTPSLTHRSEGTEVDSVEGTGRTETSELEELLQNPPHLERSVLLRLLEESRAAGIGTSYLPALLEAEESDCDTLENGDSLASTPTGEQLSRRLASRFPKDSRSEANESDSTSSSPSAVRRTSNPWPQLADSCAVAESPSGAKEERLVLPDINMYAHMTAPKRKS